jgi:hypothetical protein
MTTKKNLGLNEFFSQPLSTLPTPTSGLITLDSTNTLTAAAEILSRNRLQSAPVLNVATNSGHSWKDFTSVIDMVTIANFVLKKSQETQSVKLADLSQFVEEMTVFDNVQLKDVLGAKQARFLEPSFFFWEFEMNFFLFLLPKIPAPAIWFLYHLQQRFLTQ